MEVVKIMGVEKGRDLYCRRGLYYTRKWKTTTISKAGKISPPWFLVSLQRYSLRETESLVVADSIQTRLCCCIESIVNLKDYLHLTRVQNFQEGEITMAEEILTVLDIMLTNLEQEGRYWCMKIERLFNQGGHDDNMPSLIFVQYHFNGLPGHPKFHLDDDPIESLRAMGFSFTNISKMFGISHSMLYCHCSDFGVVHRRITDISDKELDVTIMKLKEVLSHVGERVIIGHLQCVHKSGQLQSSFMGVDKFWKLEGLMFCV